MTQSYRLKYPQAFLATIFGRNHILSIDPTEEFRASDRPEYRLYFDLDGHWNENGHAKTASLIFQYLCDRSLVPGHRKPESFGEISATHRMTLLK